MADTNVRIPTPISEPVRSYAPGAAEKPSVKARLDRLADDRTTVPMIIDGKAVHGTRGGTLHSPHRHQLVIAEYSSATSAQVGAAIKAALKARREWGAT